MRALAFLALTGCAQVLGLDETVFEQGGPDADVDASGPCDEIPASCTSTAGRSLCGQLYLPGGQPLRTTEDTPEPCQLGGAGPCQFSVSAIDYAQYTSASPGPAPGSIDTCGRWQINDFDSTVARAAVLFDAPSHIQTAALVTVDTTKAEAITGQRGYAVSMEQLVTWGGQAGLSDAPITSTGFLVSYRVGATAPGTPSSGVTYVQNNAGPPDPPNPVGTAPWAAYFEGEGPFGVITPTLTKTGPSGTALTVTDAAGAFELEGLRTTSGGGARCEEQDLHQVPGALIYLTLLRC